MSKMLHLQGKTAKGKQRVKQWGGEWLVLNEMEWVFFSQDNGPWFFVQAITDGTQNGSSTRWINSKFDKDFHILASFER
jgi:hypothetical protein